MTLINSDLGECLTPDPDSDIMPLIDMANIACGGHVGDDTSIRKTLTLAKLYGVKVGAHPSYLDKRNFGRVSHRLTSKQLFDCLNEQIKPFLNLCDQIQITMSYIKPHGALYHDMMSKPDVLATLIELIKNINPELSLVVQAGINQKELMDKSTEAGIQFIFEAFADRTYRGTQLVPRSESNAMLNQPEKIVRQYHQLSSQTAFPVDSICFHSDHLPSQHALKLLKVS